jgi:hypothetical protein
LTGEPKGRGGDDERRFPPPLPPTPPSPSAELRGESTMAVAGDEGSASLLLPETFFCRWISVLFSREKRNGESARRQGRGLYIGVREREMIF